MLGLVIFTVCCYEFPGMPPIVYMPLLFAFCLFFLIVDPKVTTRNMTLHIAGILGIFSFYFVPMGFFILYGQEIELTLAPLSLIVAALVLRWAGRDDREQRRTSDLGKLSPTLLTILEILFYAVAVISVAGGIVNRENITDAGPVTIIFFLCFSLNIFICELAFRQGEPYRIFRLMAGLFAMLVIYVTFIWTGFGRIYIGMLTVPIYVLLISYGLLKYRPVPLIGVSLLVVLGGNLFRFGFQGDYHSVLSDSTTSGLLLADELWNSKQSFALPSDMSSQFMLFFFNWMPRQLWPEKPVAVGASFVDFYMGRSGFGEGHSIALGVVGEHLYFMGGWWLPSLALAIVAFVCLRRLFAKISGGFVMPLALFDANFITFLWGGLAAFGARYFFLSMPAIAASAILTYYLGSREAHPRNPARTR
ncbi:hypothetical protein ATE71_01420 [Sphingopyxis sp. H115]|nr:hypothetical protein ATE71_01420 [Sphingopyxis sp. H115]